jgi:hypothetical protein
MKSHEDINLVILRKGSRTEFAQLSGRHPQSGLLTQHWLAALGIPERATGDLSGYGFNACAGQCRLYAKTSLRVKPAPGASTAGIAICVLCVRSQNRSRKVTVILVEQTCCQSG